MPTTPSGAVTTLPVHRIGRTAARMLADTREAVVAAVFERSFYIERAGSFACVGAAAIGDGPLHIIVGGAAMRRLLSVASVGRRARIGNGRLRIDGLELDATQACIWRPVAWPTLAEGNLIGSALDAVVKMAAAKAPDDGLARMLLVSPPPLSPPCKEDRALLHVESAIERMAAPRVAALVDWLARQLSGDGSIEIAAPVDLLGLGPGLTPSGDDVLGGVLVALAALGRFDVRDRLARAILSAARDLTTPLSAAFLAAAAEGEGSAVLHDFAGALIAGCSDTAVATAADLVRVGHTSGWDALAGVVSALSAAMAAYRPKQFP